MKLMLKKTVKKILMGLGIFDILFPNRQRDIIDIIYDEDKILAKNPSSEKDSEERKLWVKIHAIEKQIVLNHLPALKAVEVLAGDLRSILSSTTPIDHNVIIAGISALNEWARNASEKKPEDSQKILAVIEELTKESDIEKQHRNTIQIKEQNGDFDSLSFDYESFICSRHSIREFKPNIVEEPVILDIIQLAMYCPSACNRQPWKVYYSLEPDKLNTLKKLCVDQFVARNVYNYFVLTVNKNYFSDQGEIFQSWINGGIFANSLTNAIHAKGLGSCLFQTAKSHHKYLEIKTFLDIPEQEDIICMVGFGYLKNPVRFISTHRKTVESVAIRR